MPPTSRQRRRCHRSAVHSNRHHQTRLEHAAERAPRELRDERAALVLACGRAGGRLGQRRAARLGGKAHDLRAVAPRRDPPHPPRARRCDKGWRQQVKNTNGMYDNHGSRNAKHVRFEEEGAARPSRRGGGVTCLSLMHENDDADRSLGARTVPLGARRSRGLGRLSDPTQTLVSFAARAMRARPTRAAPRRSNLTGDPPHLGKALRGARGARRLARVARAPRCSRAHPFPTPDKKLLGVQVQSKIDFRSAGCAKTACRGGGCGGESGGQVGCHVPEAKSSKR